MPARERTLPTNSPEWTRVIRPRILVRDRWTCQECRAYGDQVDHKNGDHSDNSDENLQVLCIGCHSRKTARENGGFGNRKQPVIA